MRENEFPFYFVKLSWKRFFIKQCKWKIFTIRNFADLAMKTVYLVFKYVLNKNQSGWSTTFHSAFTLLSFLFFAFLD